jgi:hypothetical protein
MGNQAGYREHDYGSRKQLSALGHEYEVSEEHQKKSGNVIVIFRLFLQTGRAFYNDHCF